MAIRLNEHHWTLTPLGRKLAADLFVSNGMLAVAYWAKRFPLSRDTIISAAGYGVCIAVAKYDETTCGKIEDYARYKAWTRIRAELQWHHSKRRSNSQVMDHMLPWEQRLAEDDSRPGIDVAMDMLPQHLRMAVDLYYFREMRSAEIGEILGVGMKCVQKYHRKAYALMRKTLTKDKLHEHDGQ